MTSRRSCGKLSRNAHGRRLFTVSQRDLFVGFEEQENGEGA